MKCTLQYRLLNHNVTFCIIVCNECFLVFILYDKFNTINTQTTGINFPPQSTNCFRLSQISVINVKIQGPYFFKMIQNIFSTNKLTGISLKARSSEFYFNLPFVMRLFNASKDKILISSEFQRIWEVHLQQNYDQMLSNYIPKTYAMTISSMYFVRIQFYSIIISNKMRQHHKQQQSKQSDNAIKSQTIM